VNPILAAASEVEAFCDSYGWRYCFIGGVAVQRWGEPRLTQDVDLTLLAGFGTERPYVDRLLDRFEARRTDARDFAARYRVVLLYSADGVPIDIALGAMPFEERTIERASRFDIGGGGSITTCSAEDLIVHKAFAGRPQDWLDIDSIALRQGDALDRGLVLEEAGPLLELKEAPEDLRRLESLLGR
jgi:hypothetical protein